MCIMDVKTGEYISDCENRDGDAYIDGLIEYFEAVHIRDGLQREGIDKYSTIVATICNDGVEIGLE